MAVPWLTEMVGLASDSTEGETERGKQEAETQIKEDQARYSHRGTQRNRGGLELHADTLELHEWAQMLDLLPILGVILGHSLPLSKAH